MKTGQAMTHHRWPAMAAAGGLKCLRQSITFSPQAQGPPSPNIISPLVLTVNASVGQVASTRSLG